MCCLRRTTPVIHRTLGRWMRCTWHTSMYRTHQDPILDPQQGRRLLVALRMSAQAAISNYLNKMAGRFRRGSQSSTSLRHMAKRKTTKTSDQCREESRPFSLRSAMSAKSINEHHIGKNQLCKMSWRNFKTNKKTITQRRNNNINTT